MRTRAWRHWYLPSRHRWKQPNPDSKSRLLGSFYTESWPFFSLSGLLLFYYFEDPTFSISSSSIKMAGFNLLVPRPLTCCPTYWGKPNLLSHTFLVPLNTHSTSPTPRFQLLRLRDFFPEATLSLHLTNICKF